MLLVSVYRTYLLPICYLLTKDCSTYNQATGNLIQLLSEQDMQNGWQNSAIAPFHQPLD
jgi:hypothetical protein